MGRERKAALDLVLDSDEKASRDGAGLLRAGLELGAWSFLGTALQVSTWLCGVPAQSNPVSPERPYHAALVLAVALVRLSSACIAT